MRQVVSGVHLLEGIRGAHVYLLEGDDGLLVVDSGGPGQARPICTEIEEGDFSTSDVMAVVLTHSPSDHSGSAAELAELCKAEVWAHVDEVPFIEKRKRLPMQGGLQRFLFGVEERLMDAPACTVDRALEDGEVIDGPVAARVVHAPGHTPGAMALFLPDSKTLVTGDIVFGKLPFKAELNHPPKLFSVDPQLAKRSLMKLADIDFEAICPGHGPPIRSRAKALLRALM